MKPATVQAIAEEVKVWTYGTVWRLMWAAIITGLLWQAGVDRVLGWLRVGVLGLLGVVATLALGYGAYRALRFAWLWRDAWMPRAAWGFLAALGVGLAGLAAAHGFATVAVAVVLSGTLAGLLIVGHSVLALSRGR